MMMVPYSYLRSFLPFDDSVFGEHDRYELIQVAGRFVRAEVALAPFHIKVPVTILSWLFAGWLAALACGYPAGQAAALWEKLGGTPARSLTRLIRSLALLAYAEDPRVVARIGASTVPERQAQYRQRRTRKAEAA